MSGAHQLLPLFFHAVSSLSPSNCEERGPTRGRFTRSELLACRFPIHPSC